MIIRDKIAINLLKTKDILNTIDVFFLLPVLQAWASTWGWSSIV